MSTRLAGDSVTCRHLRSLAPRTDALEGVGPVRTGHKFRLCPTARIVGGAQYLDGVRGDRVEIVIDAGDEVRSYEIVASRNGRRVEIETGRGIVTVSEVTRSGTPVRTARFMASRILALVEHPAADQNIAREVPEPSPIRSSG